MISLWNNILGAVCCQMIPLFIGVESILRVRKYYREKGMVVGMGNSMLDLIGNVDESVLNKYNLVANNGYLAKEEHMPLFKEMTASYNGKYVVGGSVQNTFRVTQWVLGEPEICIIYGAIGCDEEGKLLVEKARAEGVDTQYQYIENRPTGICAVLLTKNGQERTLVANLSAARCFTLDHFLKLENEKRLKNASIIYISGFFLAVNVDAVLHAAKTAVERSAWVMMNLSASYVAEDYMEEWSRVMPYVDIMFGNDTEARTFAREKKFSEVNDIYKIAQELSCLPKIRCSQQRIVIITQGHNPVVVAKDGETKEYPVPHINSEKILDSTGAGDAFVGGFLAQFVLDLPIEECISCGIWCASQMIQQEGCSLDGLVRYTPRTTIQ